MTVDNFWGNPNVINGAGIVVVRFFKDGPKILGLLDGNIYDLPKGGIEDGETQMQAALRETFEEAGIYDLNFDICGFDSHIARGKKGMCKFYCAQTTDDPSVSPNPKSGYLEHLSADWLRPDELKQNLKSWLVSAVEWAENKLNDKIR